MDLRDPMGARLLRPPSDKAGGDESSIFGGHGDALELLKNEAATAVAAPGFPFVPEPVAPPGGAAPAQRLGTWMHDQVGHFSWANPSDLPLRSAPNHLPPQIYQAYADHAERSPNGTHLIVHSPFRICLAHAAREGVDDADLLRWAQAVMGMRQGMLNCYEAVLCGLWQTGAISARAAHVFAEQEAVSTPNGYYWTRHQGLLAAAAPLATLADFSAPYDQERAAIGDIVLACEDGLVVHVGVLGALDPPTMIASAAGPGCVALQGLELADSSRAFRVCKFDDAIEAVLMVSRAVAAL